MSDGGQQVVFGHVANQFSHSFRHIDKLGLDRAEVMEAIRRDLRSHLPLAARLLVGTVTVREVELKYHAYAISEDVVNVGRITGP
jgi:hypothetical protein